MTAGDPSAIAHLGDAVLRERFIGAMSRAATGVSVVSSRLAAKPFAVTVSAFNSVSADPPMMLVCINRRSPVVDAIDFSARFAVNLLSTDQVRVANVFAGRNAEDKAFDFGSAPWIGMAEGAVPRLGSAVASLCCDVEQRHDAGTHRIFIGRVIAVESSERPPLIYVGRQFAMSRTIAEDFPRNAERTRG